MHNKFIITGGAGFIGSHLAKALSRENEVVVIDDLSNGKVDNLSGSDIQLIKGSILDKEILRNAFDGTDSVFHMAAIASVKKSIEEPEKTCKISNRVVFITILIQYQVTH